VAGAEAHGRGMVTRRSQTVGEYEKYSAISPSGRNDWACLTVFFDHPSAIRRVIYTINATKSLNYSLRRLLARHIRPWPSLEIP
jgi:transposase-like protein